MVSFRLHRLAYDKCLASVSTMLYLCRYACAYLFTGCARPLDMCIAACTLGRLVSSAFTYQCTCPCDSSSSHLDRKKGCLLPLLSVLPTRSPSRIVSALDLIKSFPGRPPFCLVPPCPLPGRCIPSSNSAAITPLVHKFVSQLFFATATRSCSRPKWLGIPRLVCAWGYEK